jgi:hypothetical protein
MEYWNNGIMGKKGWTNGITEHWVHGKRLVSVSYSHPIFQHSSIPLFQPPILPPFHYSIIPPVGPYSTTPFLSAL